MGERASGGWLLWTDATTCASVLSLVTLPVQLPQRDDPAFPAHAVAPRSPPPRDPLRPLQPRLDNPHPLDLLRRSLCVPPLPPDAHPLDRRVLPYEADERETPERRGGFEGDRARRGVLRRVGVGVVGVVGGAVIVRRAGRVGQETARERRQRREGRQRRKEVGLQSDATTTESGSSRSPSRESSTGRPGSYAPSTRSRWSGPAATATREPERPSRGRRGPRVCTSCTRRARATPAGRMQRRERAPRRPGTLAWGPSGGAGRGGQRGTGAAAGCRW